MMRSTKNKDHDESTTSQCLRRILLYIRIHKAMVLKGVISIAIVTVIVLLNNKKTSVTNLHRRTTRHHHNEQQQQEEEVLLWDTDQWRPSKQFSFSFDEEEATMIEPISRIANTQFDSIMEKYPDAIHISANGDDKGWFVSVPPDDDASLKMAKKLVAHQILLQRPKKLQSHPIDLQGPHRLVDEEGKAYLKASNNNDDDVSRRLHLLLPRESFVHAAVDLGFVRTLRDGTMLQTLSLSPRVFLVDPILSVPDCEELIDESSQRGFERSGEKHYSPGYENYRTSLTGHTPFTGVGKLLWKRVCNVTGLDEEMVEFPAMIKYETDVSWYKQHMDYFHSFEDKPLEDLRRFIQVRVRELQRYDLIPEALASLAEVPEINLRRSLNYDALTRLVHDLNLSLSSSKSPAHAVHHFLQRSKKPLEDFSRAAISLAAYYFEGEGNGKASQLAKTYFRFDHQLEQDILDYIPFVLKPSVEVNRHVTVLPILRDAEEGGHTAFPHSTSDLGIPPGSGETIAECRKGLIVKPTAGQALMFYNRLPTGEKDPLSEHAGCSVQKGEKYAANCFTWDEDKRWSYRFQQSVDELYRS